MKKQEGITLIALIITIIIMMILVGVTVTVAIKGELFDKAKQAATGMTMAQIQEKMEMIKYAVLIDAESGNNSFSVVEEYKRKLKDEFGEENITILGNNITIFDKYKFIIKNTNLDIDVNNDNNELVVGITTTRENSDVDGNGNIHAVMMNFNLFANMTSEEYIKNITIDERKEAILSEFAGWYDQKFETLYDVICYEFDVGSMEEYIYENEGVENATLGQIYYYYVEGTCEGEYTEEEFIDILNSWDIGIADTYYSKKTKNLKAIMVANGKETVLGTNYSVDSKPVVEFLIHENGVYDFKILDYNNEIVAYEKVIVNNIVGNEVGYYVPADGTWITDGKGKAKEYTGTDTEVIIPTYVGTEKITVLDNTTQYSGKSVFYGNKGALKKVTIPKSITTIGRYAFFYCKSLEEVIIPNSVKEIGESAFGDCTNLKEITIPNSIKTLEYNLFNGCTNLVKVTIPNSVTSCIASIFKDCTSLREIELPDSITTLGGGGTFSGCTNLEKVKLPSTITELPASTFKGCSALKEIKIPDTVTSMSEQSADIGGTFEGCTGLTEITIPNNVSTIGRYAFKGCTGLTEIRIPKSVTSMENSIFIGCTNLKNIYVEEGTTLTIPETTPWGAPNATVTVVPVE